MESAALKIIKYELTPKIIYMSVEYQNNMNVCQKSKYSKSIQYNFITYCVALQYKYKKSEKL